MNKIIHIDEDNMYAIVQPYVSYAELQAETMKKGLWLPSPAAPSTVGIISNMLYCGMTWALCKYGFARRSCISLTWITPKGEIIKTGSSAIDSLGNFWWNGPGPDLKGLFFGAVGELGICTEMTVKLHPWVGGPHLKADDLPDNTKMFFIVHPTIEQMIEAQYELSRAQIATFLGCLPLNWSIFASVKTKEESEEFWEKRKQGKNFWTPKSKIKRFFLKLALKLSYISPKSLLMRLFRKLGNYPERLLVVCIMGTTLRKQLKYGEKIIKDIVKETNGMILPSPTLKLIAEISGTAPFNEFFRPKISPRIMRFKGGFVPIFFPQEPLEQTPKSEHIFKETLEKYPRFPTDYHRGAILPVDMGHFALHEMDIYYDQTNIEELKMISKIGRDVFSAALDNKIWPHCEWKRYSWDFLNSVPNIASTHRKLSEKLKQVVDPNKIMNPEKWI